MDISGTWYNELGSQLDFIVNGEQLTGSYQTKVGDASGVYPLVGRLNTSLETGQSLAFVVLWKNDQRDNNSVTSWSGQAQVIQGEGIISTTWLLTSETEPGQDWHSTLVGKDLFTRCTPDMNKLQKNGKAFPSG